MESRSSAFRTEGSGSAPAALMSPSTAASHEKVRRAEGTCIRTAQQQAEVQASPPSGSVPPRSLPTCTQAFLPPLPGEASLRAGTARSAQSKPGGGIAKPRNYSRPCLSPLGQPRRQGPNMAGPLLGAPRRSPHSPAAAWHTRLSSPRAPLTSPHSFKATVSSSASFCPPEASSSKGSQSLCRAPRTNSYSADSRSRA